MPGELHAIWIGQPALELLGECSHAVVLGVSSRGAFLQLVPEHSKANGGFSGVVFLSSETYRGPLTINVGEADLAGLGVQMPAVISIERIQVSQAGITIYLEQAKPWQPPPPIGQALDPHRSRQLLDALAGAVLNQRQPSAIGLELPSLLGLPGYALQPSGSMLAQILRLQLAAQAAAQDSGSYAVLVGEMEAFLGLGSGLTPSGDDMILGLLLAWSRWGHVLAPRLEMDLLAVGLLPLARRKTTALSAGLIACASRGLADERLILASDSLLVGTPGTANAARCLLEWGSSSGMDALVGMAIAVLAA